MNKQPVIDYFEHTLTKSAIQKSKDHITNIEIVNVEMIILILIIFLLVIIILPSSLSLLLLK